MESMEKIRELCLKYNKDLIKLVCDLVMIPSVNGENDEIKVAEKLNDCARKLGLPSELIALNPKRPNVFVGNNMDNNSGLLLIAHLDTVPIGDKSKWKHGPFEGEIDKGKLYGRGAIDCKTGAALSIFTLKILQDLGKLDKAKFVGVVDEEGAPDSSLGAAYLLKKGLKAKAAIYTYPNVHSVTIGHRGIVRLWVEVQGEAAHSGTKEWQFKTKGASAIEAIAEFILRLKEISMNGENENFPGYKFIHTVTLLEGGSGESIVPDKAKLLIDARILPEHNPDEYIEKIKRLAKSMENGKIKLEIKTKNKIPGALISKNEKIVKILTDLDREVMGVEPEVKGCGPVNEGYMFIKAGIPTICGFGAQGEGAHSADEYVNVETLPKILEMYVRAATLLDV